MGFLLDEPEVGLGVEGVLVVGTGVEGVLVVGLGVEGVLVVGLGVEGVLVVGLGVEGVLVVGLGVEGVLVVGLGVEGVLVVGLGVEGVLVVGLGVEGVLVVGLGVEGILEVGAAVLGVTVPVGFTVGSWVGLTVGFAVLRSGLVGSSVDTEVDPCVGLNVVFNFSSISLTLASTLSSRAESLCSMTSRAIGIGVNSSATDKDLNSTFSASRISMSAMLMPGWADSLDTSEAILASNSWALFRRASLFNGLRVGAQNTAVIKNYLLTDQLDFNF